MSQDIGIYSVTLHPLWVRHWSPSSFDPRFWVLFGMSHWGVSEKYCVVDDFGNLTPVGEA